jgi:hypothetical protein
MGVSASAPGTTPAGWSQYQQGGSSGGAGSFLQPPAYSGGFVGAPGGGIQRGFSGSAPGAPHSPASMSMTARSAEEQREIGEALLALSPPRSHLKEPPHSSAVPMPSLLLELESSQQSKPQSQSQPVTDI